MSSTNEQSMLQMHERERKLKELQAKLAEDNTPEKKADDSQKNVSQSSPSVFDRLYAHKKQSTPVKSTPKKAPATPGSTSRINALYESGQKGLRSKVMTAKEEEEVRRKRKEEEELAACTFTPQTKWQLAKERRQVASEFKEVTAKAPKLTEHERRVLMEEESKLKHCTFQPQTKWNIAAERRKAKETWIWDNFR